MCPLLQEHQAQAVFNQTEDYVMFPDEATTSLCVWDSRNASRKQLLSLGHNGPVRNSTSHLFTSITAIFRQFRRNNRITCLLKVRWMVHSPTHAAFLSCSDDFRARFWYRRHWNCTRCTETSSSLPKMSSSMFSPGKECAQQIGKVPFTPVSSWQ